MEAEKLEVKEIAKAKGLNHLWPDDEVVLSRIGGDMFGVWRVASWHRLSGTGPLAVISEVFHGKRDDAREEYIKAVNEMMAKK